MNSKKNIVDQPLNTNTDQEVRTIFNTNTDINTPVQIPPPETESTEVKKVDNINKLFSNWEITKDQETLKQLTDMTGGADNEAFYEPWVKFFVNGNSGELIKTINTSTNKKETTQKIFYIFEWFINGSGEYEKLSSTRRQEISNQYNQLKRDLGIK